MNQILHLLHSKVIPWTSWNGRARLIVARQVMKAAALPPGVTLSPRPIKGNRRLIKDQRNHANQRLLIAEWPEANLHQIASPKLSCIVDGSADYLLGKYCMHCAEGNFILIPPRMPHHRTGSYIEAPQHPGRTCTLLQAYTYSHDVLLWVCRSQGSQHFDEKRDNFLIPNGEAAQIFHLLIEEANLGQEGFEVICHHLLAAFFSLLARDISEGRYTQLGPQFNSTPLPSPTDNFVGRLEEYIGANLNKQITIDDAAAHLFMSRSQFCRRVRRETGGTFGELLTSYRINFAQRMLRETDWTVTLISKLAGLQSPTYFQGLFRRRVGCTTSEYRYKHTNKSLTRKK